MKNLFCLTILFALLLSLSACGGGASSSDSEPAAPTQTSAPPMATSTSEPETLELVVIGDAFDSNYISQAYPAAVETDMGVETNLFRWLRNGRTLHTFLEDFQTNEELRQSIKDADIILLGVTPRWTNTPESLFLGNTCRGNDNQDCLREATATAKCYWKGIADILVELRGGKPVVLRAIVWGDWLYPAVYGDKITPEQITVLASYYNDYQAFMASTPGIRTALVFAESYDKIPPEYIPDGLHLSEVGSAAAVDLLRETGYEPAILGSPDMTNANLDCASVSQ